jgi:hypothetical protein
MNGDTLDLRDGRNLLSYLAGIGVELLLTLAYVGIGAAVVAVFRLLLP